MLSLLFILLNTVFAAAPNQSPETPAVFVETNLKVGMRVSGNHYEEWRSGLLQQKKNKNDSIDFVSFAYKPNGRYFQNKELDYNLVANVGLAKSTDDIDAEYEWEVAHPKPPPLCNSNCEYVGGPVNANTYYVNSPLVRALRNTKLNLNFSQNKNSTLVFVALKDKQSPSKGFQIGGGKNQWNLAVSGDQINGTVRVGYHLPKDTWAVVIERRSRNGVFNLPQVDKSFQNAFNSNLPMRNNERYIVWGKPDTDVYQEFSFDNYSQGSSLEGSFEVVVTPIDFSGLRSMPLDEIARHIYSIEPYSSNVSFDTHIQNIRYFLYLMSNPEVRESLMSSLTTNQVIKLITKLSDMSYNFNAVAAMWDLKAASVILSSELSLSFLKQIVPFCRDEKIVLPYTQKETQILGLRLANFFLEKAKMRLEYEHFKHYETLIKLLSSYNGKSFAQIRNNKTEALKIKKAYDVLVNTVDMRLSAFKAAYEEVKFIYDKFGSLGAPGNENTTVYELMKSINGKDSEFNTELLSFLRSFQPDNNSIISTRVLTASLEKVKANQSAVIEQISSKIKIAGFTPSEQNTTFIQSIQAMTIHNLDILTQSLDGSFENFRKSYMDEAKVKNITSQIQGCVR